MLFNGDCGCFEYVFYNKFYSQCLVDCCVFAIAGNHELAMVYTTAPEFYLCSVITIFDLIVVKGRIYDLNNFHHHCLCLLCKRVFIRLVDTKGKVSTIFVRKISVGKGSKQAENG